ncbi:PREDICTED: G/T mismatch-specific thymine DNA glycosylase-like [Acropora digitifera]|uniref:G/T mismatch-specific thymine DNA glycosylase-like n=1 Tax=Acropora digitifera TaxID=70779 RepID=UPI00077A5A7D|nr:PREDICTED: G/T mismatch-specific thymine DNA glycosylase-like [Acropora digitifera]
MDNSCTAAFDQVSQGSMKQNRGNNARYSPYFVNDSSSSQEDSAGKGVQNANQEKQSRKSPKKPRQPVNRFGEMSEEDVLKRTLPEHLGHNLDILFVGINPGLMSAYKGHHYPGGNNHFCR